MDCCAYSIGWDTNQKPGLRKIPLKPFRPPDDPIAAVRPAIALNHSMRFKGRQQIGITEIGISKASHIPQADRVATNFNAVTKPRGLSADG
jgi:hypothetical protein